jgi:ubiquinone/menaquinone biosynthesis C-methylase UbiE
MLFKNSQNIDSENTKFKYFCENCKNTDYLHLTENLAHCNHCNKCYPLTHNNVILFDQDMTEQNKHFDKLYGSDLLSEEDDFNKNFEGEYQASKNKAKNLLKLWDIDKLFSLKGKSFLDAACGPGWLTAGLMQNEKIQNASFHAFDISATGLEMLAEFTKDLKNSNSLELSVQNAENMRFQENSFDVIIGNSMLHHLFTYETFLKDCYRILKPGGVAIFGEPFAIGYGLLAASLQLAQNDLAVHYPELDNFYNDIAFQVKSPRKRLKKLIDKHIFFQSEILPMVQKIGFSSVDFKSLMDRKYYRDQFVTNELRLSYGISDERLIERANTIYKVFFDLFDSEKFVHCISAFIYLIIRP